MSILLHYFSKFTQKYESLLMEWRTFTKSCKPFVLFKQAMCGFFLVFSEKNWNLYHAYIHLWNNGEIYLPCISVKGNNGDIYPAMHDISIIWRLKKQAFGRARDQLGTIERLWEAEGRQSRIHGRPWSVLSSFSQIIITFHWGNRLYRISRPPLGSIGVSIV
jgi:hypothetical protein